jgi:hypothetical protein
MIKCSNPAIKSHIKNVFKLTEHDYYILSEFSKIGETYRNRINLASLSDRQISRRVDVLYENNFLILIKSTPYRNIPGKKTRIFGLTFKGFLASLNHINLENMYLFKSYQKIIETTISLDIIPFYVKYIKYSLIYFFEIIKNMGIKLDDVPDVVNLFEKFSNISILLNHDNESLKNLKKNVDNCSKDIELNIPENICGQEQMEDWYYLRDYWNHTIEKISEGKTMSKIISQLKKEFPSRLENEIQRNHMNQIDLDLINAKKTQLKVEHRIKSTKYAN